MHNKELKKYNDLFTDDAEIEKQFELEAGFLKKHKIKILFAWYDYQDYSGEAFIVAKQGKDLLEVNAGHCSCYGLEGQWKLEPTSLEVIGKRGHYNPEMANFFKDVVQFLKKNKKA